MALGKTVSDLHLSPKSARAIVAVMLACKLGATLYVVVASDMVIYDEGHHVERAESAGLEISRRHYNPPLYYLPIAPFRKGLRAAAEESAERALAAEAAAEQDVGKEASSESSKSHRRRLKKKIASEFEARVITFFRWNNLVYWIIFYCLWLYVIFPAVLPDWRSSFLASVLLLSIPAFQRTAKMAHPDNLLCALTAVCFASWIVAERNTRTKSEGDTGARRAHSWACVIGLALPIGLAGATRPFSISCVVVFCSALLWLLFRQKGRWGQLATKGLLAAALIAVLSGSWWAYRKAVLPYGITDVYASTRYTRDQDTWKYASYRKTFDMKHYFTSFYPKPLLEVPNRTYSELDTGSAKTATEPSYFTNRYANSFPTIFYSETWGDHWLYFSGKGPVDKDERIAEKRRILAVALLPSLVLLLGAAGSLLGLLWNASRRRWPTAPQVVLLALMVASFSLFVYWQTGDGLKPGRQTTVKFLYVAYAVPTLVSLPFMMRIRGFYFNVLATMMAILFLVAFPVSLPLTR